MANGFDVRGRALQAGELAAWLAEHSLGNRFGMAVAGTGLAHDSDDSDASDDSEAAKTRALAIVAADGDGRYIDVAALTPDDEAALASWLADPGPPKAVHDAKLVMHALAGRGWTLRGVTSDTALTAHLLRPERRSLSLNELLVRHMRCALPAESVEQQQYLSQRVQLLILTACAVLDLADVLDEELARIDSSSLLGRVELPIQRVLAEMESAGIAVDRALLVRIHNQLDEEMRATAAADGLLDAIGSDGRIHTTFRQTRTTTGRLSSSDPDLHDISIHLDAGRQLRDAFVAGDGYVELMAAAYGQLEMRLIAHLSGDQELIEAFSNGADPYLLMASRAFSIPIDKVTPQLRQRINAMLYALTYGLSATDEDDNLAGALREYLSGAVEDAQRTGYACTVLGRRRYLPELNSDNPEFRQAAERAALTMAIQGSAADIIKLAMIELNQAIKDAGLKSRMVLQVNNTLVFEVAEGERDMLATYVREHMGCAYSLEVPLEVSVGFGPNWGAAAH